MRIMGNDVALDDRPEHAALDSESSPYGLAHGAVVLARIFDAIPAGVVVTDARGTIALVNAETERLFGYERSELIGRPVEQLMPSRNRDAHRGHRERYVRAPVSRAMGAGRELHGRRRDGSEFPIEIGLRPIAMAGGTGVIATIVDITVRRALEADLRRANEDLDDFASIASHDLKAPLRGIASLTEWLIEDLTGVGTPDALRNLERIAVRIARMERLIDDLLAFARAGRTGGDTVVFDPAEMIESLREMLAIPDGFTLTADCRVSTMIAPRTPIETVLRNLIDNAVKHHDRAEGHIDVRVEAEEAAWVLSVIDDGPGVPEGARERIFKLFQTLGPKEGGGTGLGLAVAKSLVARHGGTIAARANEGGRRGTTFVVRWPRTRRAP